MDTLAVIMAGDRGRRLSVLSQQRAKAAVPFAGKYRIIDFALSNCANSGILSVGILVQYQPHSLNDHIRTGQPWDLNRRLTGGVTLLQPYQRHSGSLDWYRGTADALYQNLDFILEHQADTVLVLSSDCVYKMDYTPLLHYHQQHQADATICAIDAPLSQASQPGILTTDGNSRAVTFRNKPSRSLNSLACMGIYVFQTDVLMQRLNQDAQQLDSDHDLGKNVLPRMLALGDQIHIYRFEGRWADVQTVQTYWQANMDLLSPDPSLNLLDSQWSIHTRSEKRPPANICSGAAVSNSLINDGCIIKGRVESSILSPGVHVGIDAVVRDSVVLNDCKIGAGAVVERAILDKNVVIGKGSYIGFDLDYVSDHYPPGKTDNGLTLVGKNTRLPAGLWVSRECVIDSDLTESDFATDFVVSSRHADLQRRNNVFVDFHIEMADNLGKGALWQLEQHAGVSAIPVLDG